MRMFRGRCELVEIDDIDKAHFKLGNTRGE